MSWRTVVVKSRGKLDYSMNNLVIRNEEGVKKVYIGEVATVVVENPAVSVTAVLMNELVKNKIRVIFCDTNHNPAFELQPYVLAHDGTEKIRKQISWQDSTKDRLWQWIVREKIRNQKAVLVRAGKKGVDFLEKYIDEVELRDSGNREGLAAKVYFNALFGDGFVRDSDTHVNAALNYGYSLLLSAVSREICLCGYLLQLGIFHDNAFNPYNLSCDFMEPFRPMVDWVVFNAEVKQFSPDTKKTLIAVSNTKVSVNGRETRFDFGIGTFVKSCLDALCGDDMDKLKPLTYEL